MIAEKLLSAHEFKNKNKFQSFKTNQAAFIKIIDEIDIINEKQIINNFLENYDFKNSKDLCNEKAFANTIRIIPAIPEIVGSLDRNAPYSNSGFEYNEKLLYAIRSIIYKFTNLFETTTGEKWRASSVCLSVLAPDEVLRPHIDGYVAHLWAEKIHIPIISNDYCLNTKSDIKFTNHEFNKLDTSGHYIINNLEPHSAVNFGDCYRTHLIFDLLPTDNLIEIRTQLPNISDNIYRIQSDCAIVGNSIFHKALDEKFINKDDYNSVKIFYKTQLNIK